MNRFITYLLYGEHPPRRKPKRPTEPGWFGRNRKRIIEKGNSPPPSRGVTYVPKSKATAH